MGGSETTVACGPLVMGGLQTVSKVGRVERNTSRTREGGGGGGNRPPHDFIVTG